MSKSGSLLTSVALPSGERTSDGVKLLSPATTSLSTQCGMIFAKKPSLNTATSAFLCFMMGTLGEDSRISTASSWSFEASAADVEPQWSKHVTNVTSQQPEKRKGGTVP